MSLESNRSRKATIAKENQMAVKFADLKKGKGKFKELLQAVEKETAKGQGGFDKDERLWQPTVDEAGNGYAVIRFLPAPEGEDHPWVRVYSHGFKGPTGKWYIENSLTTLGQEDPVGEFNSALWAKGDDASKKQARDQARRTSFYSNILVIDDPKNPSNNGKVFIFRYGKKIFEKIKDAMNPEFQDEEPVNPFDFWEGANFKLKIRQVEGYRNYDKSEFEKPSAISNDDDELEKIWKQQHSLQAFLAPSEFKSYEELKRKLHVVLGLVTAAAAAASVPAQDEQVDRVVDSKPKAAPAPKKEPVAETASGDDDDDDLEFFRRLESDDSPF
jgi:hypothetical protein